MISIRTISALALPRPFKRAMETAPEELEAVKPASTKRLGFFAYFERLATQAVEPMVSQLSDRD